MKLLAGGTKALFGELLGGSYLVASLDGGEPDYTGDGTLQAGSDARPCKARVDNATERMRGAEGFTETDRAISILAATVVGEVTTDNTITLLEGDYAGVAFHIASVDRPPGASYYYCRGKVAHG